MIIVTGGFGMIGSNIVKALNEMGRKDILVVDNLKNGEKFINLVDLDIADYCDKEDFIASIIAGDDFGDIDAVFHEGACSATTEWDGKYLMHNNYEYSKELLHFCLDRQIPFFYASSAATYGGRSDNFIEKREFEGPLNAYGYSKFLFDEYVRRILPEADSPVCGFKYFNVYGPREQHKGRMASVAYHHFNQYREQGYVNLFGGYEGYGNGCQSRDFISVEDIVKTNLYFLDHPELSGIYNLGTGRSQPFNDLAAATVNACRAAEGKPVLALDELVHEELIRYTPFPDALKGKYQSFTQADTAQLRQAGYTADFYTVEQGVSRYVEWLLAHSE